MRFWVLRRGFSQALTTFGIYTLFFIAIRNISFSWRSWQYRHMLHQMLPEFPSVTLDYGRSPYNHSKVALIVENRAIGNLAPLILHMISVVPPDWRFRFMGSEISVSYINTSIAIRRQVEIGKLDLTYIPPNMSVTGGEQVSRFLTSLWLYETVLQPAEWLLLFQTDSILCASSLDDLDDYLEYDWVGAPWSVDSRYGGNGGLSMRRVSSIIRILQHQQRLNDSEPEDLWLTERLGHLPDTRVANGSTSLKFSSESQWIESPMGYHTGGSGSVLNGGVWGNQERRKKIWEYCPEIKITLDMDLANFMPQLCGTEW